MPARGPLWLALGRLLSGAVRWCLDSAVGPWCLDSAVGPWCLDPAVGPWCLDPAVGPWCLDPAVGPCALPVPQRVRSARRGRRLADPGVASLSASLSGSLSGCRFRCLIESVVCASPGTDAYCCEAEACAVLDKRCQARWIDNACDGACSRCGAVAA